MSLPSCPFDPPLVSICPSETEEAASDHEEEEEDDLDDLDEVDEQDNAEEDEEEECTCEAEGVSSCWKCAPSTSQAAATSDSAALLSTVAAVPEEDFEGASAVVAHKSASHGPGENIDEIVQLLPNSNVIASQNLLSLFTFCNADNRQKFWIRKFSVKIKHVRIIRIEKKTV